jgi:tetratricopeptide (TPR) repeat protein
MILDSHGKPYAKTGYQAGGPSKYLSHLSDFASREKDRDDLLSKTKGETPDKRILTLEELMGLLNKWEVGFGYPEIKEEIVSLDADNKSGFRLKYAMELAQYFNHQGNPDKVNANLAIIKKLDPNKARNVAIGIKIDNIETKFIAKENWTGALDEFQKLFAMNPDAETIQVIYYYMAKIYHTQKDTVKAMDCLEKAVKAAPESLLAGQITNAWNELKKLLNDAKQKTEEEAPPVK